MPTTTNKQQMLSQHNNNLFSLEKQDEFEDASLYINKHTSNKLYKGFTHNNPTIEINEIYAGGAGSTKEELDIGDHFIVGNYKSWTSRFEDSGANIFKVITT